MEPKYWIPYLEWRSIVADAPEETGGDADTLPEIKGIHGGCEIIPSLSKGDARAIRALTTPEPKLFALAAQDVRLDDGWLSLTADQQEFGLLAKSDVLDIPEDVDLIYTFRFHHVTYNGKDQDLPTIVVKAPELAEGVVVWPTVNVAEMEWLDPSTAVTGGYIIRQVPDDVGLVGDDVQFYANGVALGAPLDLLITGVPGSVSDLSDATPFMKSVLTDTDDAVEARTAIQAPSYLRPARSFDASNGTDDTAAVQAVFSEYVSGDFVVRGGNTLLIDANPTTGGLLPAAFTLSDSRLIIEEGATVQVKTNALDLYYLLNLVAAQNVTIENNGVLLGDALTHTGTTGQYGHLVNITNGCANIRLVGGGKVKEAWGDGVYVGGGTTSVNYDILLDGWVADDCRREAFSPFWVDGMTIRNYKINGGPAALIEPVLGNGIDVEPNDSQWVTDLTIEQGVIEGLIGNGIYASPLPAGGTAPYIRNFKIFAPRVIGCGQDPTVGGHGNNIYVKDTEDLLLVDPYSVDAGTVGDALACNVKLSGITGAKIRGGELEASSGEGLQVSLCPGLDIAGLSARNNRKRGANIDQSDGARVRHSEFTDNLLDNTAGSGHLRFTNCDNFLAARNTFVGDQGGAWVSADASCTDGTVRGNEGLGAAPTAMIIDLGTNTVEHLNFRKDTGVYEAWSTADKIATGTVELGDDSDTTLARSAAGRVTVEGAEVITATAAAAVDAKTTPVDADTVVVFDSAASGVPKKSTWASIKTTLAAWLGLLPSGTAVAIHNQADQVTNFERVRAFFGSNIAQLMTEQGGSGTYRDLRVGVANTHYAGFSISNPKIHLVTAASGNAGAFQQATQSGLTGASVAQTGFKLATTVNQTGTSSYIGLEIAVTETGTGSGTKKPVSVTVGGSEKFAVDNAGVVTAAPSATAGTAVVRAAVPATASSTGIAGQIAWDASHIYLCTATNTWVRAAVATW